MKLEDLQVKLEDLQDLLAKHAEQDQEVQKEILSRLGAIESTLKRYQGFVAGMVFILSAFWVLVTTFGKDLFLWLRG